MTALAPNLLATLSPLHAATKGPQGYGFANPKNPAVKALETSGHIVGDHNTKNPADPAQVAYQVTDLGHAQFPGDHTNGQENWQLPPAAASFPDPGTGTVAPASPQPFTGTGPVAGVEGDAPAVAAAVRKPRGPNAPIHIVHTGQRVAFDMDGASAPRGREEKWKFAQLQPPVEGQPHDSFFIKATDDHPEPARAFASNVSKANKKFKDEGRAFGIVAVANDPEHGVAGARVFRSK